MKNLINFATLFLFAAPVLAAPPAAPASFTVSNPSGIPGTVLDPGPYTISIVNRLSDRVLLRVEGRNGAFHSTFIGIPNSEIAKPSTGGPVRWSSSPNGPSYLKGWYFAGMPSVIEFVYPKAEALAIASSNPSTVPAVDPASEGKVTDSTLSQEDMELLTLWLLSVEQVKSGDAAPTVKAVRYQASVSNHKPVINALPHTASFLPLMWLLGLCSVVTAGSIRVVRRYRRAVAALRLSAGRSHVNSCIL